MRLILVLILALLPTFSMADEEEIVLGLSQNRVAITARFDGSDIFLFGAVKRETTIPEGNLEVIVAIEGPSGPVKVRLKERRYGIWINATELEVDRAPSFYAVATSGPLTQVLKSIENQRHKITVERAIRNVGAPAEIKDVQAFTDAVIRIQENNGSYLLLENAVEVDQQTLFRTSIALPSNLTEGDYRARIFLTRDGKVVSRFETSIDVRKVGLERFLYKLAQEQAPIYGILSILMAVFAGWGASALFRLVRDR
ncbi:MAG: TIGR02186 family protein [Thalassovita sp.]